MCVDDLSIDGSVRLYRRVQAGFIVHDEDRDCIRLASGAFQSVEMSVAIEDRLESPDDVLAGYEGYALVEFRVEDARELGLAVCRDELPDDPAHALVAGKKTGGRQRALARASRWTVPPENGCEPPAT